MQDLELLDLLQKYGSIIFTGSYNTNLMVWSDIDIQLVLDNPDNKIEIFSQISAKLLTKPDINKITLINFTPGKKPNMPVGLYMGIEYKSDIKWKIDTWSLEESHFLKDKEFNRLIQSKLNDNLRNLILEMKTALVNLDGRIPQSASYYLYKAIFEQNLYNKKDILLYLMNNGIKL